MSMRRVLVLFFLGLVGGGFAVSADGDENPRYRRGTWVNYQITASERQLYFSLSGNNDYDPQAGKDVFTCRLSVLKNERGKLQIDLEAKNSSITLTNATLNDILLGDLLPPEKNQTHGIEKKVTLAATASSAAREISATEITVVGEGKKITLVKSEEVPFGIVEIVCGAFQLKLLEYQW